jgi:hypothetical protein
VHANSSSGVLPWLCGNHDLNDSAWTSPARVPPMTWRWGMVRDGARSIRGRERCLSPHSNGASSHRPTFETRVPCPSSAIILVSPSSARGLIAKSTRHLDRRLTDQSHDSLGCVHGRIRTTKSAWSKAIPAGSVVAKTYMIARWIPGCGSLSGCHLQKLIDAAHQIPVPLQHAASPKHMPLIFSGRPSSGTRSHRFAVMRRMTPHAASATRRAHPARLLGPLHPRPLLRIHPSK